MVKPSLFTMASDSSVLDVMVTFWQASTSEHHLWVGVFVKLASNAAMRYNWVVGFVSGREDVL